MMPSEMLKHTYNNNIYNKWHCY